MRFRIVALVVLVTTLPITGGALRAAYAGWAPTGDEGAIQTWTWDSGTGNTPLVGMPSTVAEAGEVHHPGPMQFWLLAGPARLVRAVTDSAASLVLAQAFVNAALLALGFAAVATASARRSSLMSSAGVAAVTLWAVGATIVFSPYNPEFAFVALVAAAVACYATLRAPATALAPVALVITASVAGQPHLSYAFPAAALLGVGAVAVARTRPSRRRTTVLVSTLALCWLGPIIDVVTHRGGNIRAYFTAAGADGGDRTGVARATQRLVRTLSPWDLGMQRAVLDFPDLVRSPSAASWVVAVAVLVAAASAWWHRPLRRYAAGVFAVVAVTLLGLAIAPYGFAVTFAPHMLRLFVVPAVMVWVLAIAAVVGRVRATTAGWSAVRPNWVPAFRFASITSLVALSAVPVTVASSDRFVDEPTCTEAVRVLTAATPAGTFNLDARTVQLQALWFETFVTTGYYSELVARGDEGRLVGSPPTGYFAASRLTPDPDAPSQLVLLTGGLTPPGAATLLASVYGSGCGRSSEGDPVAELSLWKLDGSTIP